MEIKDYVTKNVKLTETEKDILDEAYSVIDRLDYLLLDYLIVNSGERMYTAKDIKKILSLLEDLVDADSIIAG